MNKIIEQLKKLPSTDLGMVIILGVITLITFGIFTPFAGFYWDDWIWKYFSHAYSSGYLLWQPIDRPLAGTLHILLDALFGDNPLNWQLGMLFFRGANAIGFYFLLRKVFPAQRNIPAIISVFFLVFPVFTEQWISIAFIHHLVPMSVLWVSFIFMFAGIETEHRVKRYLKLGLSVLLAVLVMLTTEYFYGIEVFRMVLLFYYFCKSGSPRKPLNALWETAKIWWFYAIMIALMVIWRSGLGIAEGATYSVKFSRIFSQGILAGMVNYLSKMVVGLYAATIKVLIRSFSLPSMAEFGQIKTIMFYGLVLGVLILGFFFFRKLLASITEKRGTALELIMLGSVGMLIGGQPFWLGGLQYLPSFPADRVGLTLMMGISLLIVGLVLLVARFRLAAPMILALVAAFSIGSNFIYGAAYAQSWKDQQVFWRQFTSRVPALESGTIVVPPDLPPAFMNDLSFMMTLNWLYDLEPDEAALNYGLFFSKSRVMFKSVSEGMPLVYDHRMVKIESEIGNILVISYNENACLHIFSSTEGTSNPNVRQVDHRLLPYSNQELIDLNTPLFEYWPDFFAPIPENTWCVYFEMAELALQREDYSEIARIGDQAFSIDEMPKKAWERAPFIEGYGFEQRWEEAVFHTQKTIEKNKNTEELLCEVWARIENGTPESEDKQGALNQIDQLLSCGN